MPIGTAGSVPLGLCADDVAVPAGKLNVTVCPAARFRFIVGEVFIAAFSVGDAFIDAQLVRVEITGELFAVLAEQFVCFPLDQLCLDASHILKEWPRIYKAYGRLWVVGSGL